MINPVSTVEHRGYRVVAEAQKTLSFRKMLMLTRVDGA